MKKNRILSFFSIVTVSVFTVNGVLFSAQPLIDLHGFRQTQTAVTAYWMNLDSNFIQFNYPLPIIGSPWSSPFELPLFQSIVAVIGHITHFEIDQIGRLLALVSSLLILIPLYKITLILKLPLQIFYFSVILIYSSPQYLYWSRTFLIETFSVLLTFVTIYLYFKMKINLSIIGLIGFTMFSTAAILVKVTTSVTPLLFLLVLELVSLARIWKMKRVFKFKDLVLTFGLLFSFLSLEYWVQYADAIKANGGISRYLTSSNLSGWTIGNVSQRFSSDFWYELIFKKNLVQNPMTLIGITLFIWFIFKRKSHLNFILSLSFLWLFPMLLFSNLHIVHIYYQTENLIYLLILTSITICTVLENSKTEIRLLFLAILAFASNLLIFSDFYFSHQLTNSSDSTDLAISRIVLNETASDSILIGIGKDWNPTIPYYSRRYSVMVPDWLPDKFSLLSSNQFDSQSDRLVGSFLFCKPIGVAPFLDDIQVVWLVQKWKLDKEISIENCQFFFRNGLNTIRS